MSFMVKKHEYKYGYYICDEIYPFYSTFVKAYIVPRTEKAKMFTKMRICYKGYRKGIWSPQIEMTYR